MSEKTATLYQAGYMIGGKYELEELLGQGGMGAVWRAHNVALDASVAIKVVRAAGDGALLRGRLVQEARAAAKLTHAAIVKVFDVGETESGDPFIVMELLQGDSLQNILETEGRLPAVQAVRLMLPICDALWLAHDKEVIHRDVKPDNIFVVQHDGAIQPTLVDFGIVKVQRRGSTSHLTKAGDVLGSPDYMSPEQARGQDDVTHLTDMWSFAVVLFEAISGSVPFKGANYNALLRQIVEGTPPTLYELAAADAELSAIVARALSKEPEQRFATMGELGRVLAKWLIDSGVTEDICGTTLDAKWLRGTGRAALTSIADAWPVEFGSGVRLNALDPLNTLTARASVSEAPGSLPAPSHELADVPRFLPNRRPKWLATTLVVAAVALALTWLVSRRNRPTADAAPGLVRTAGAASVGAALPAPLRAPSIAADWGVGGSAGPVEGPAKSRNEPVSSKIRRAPAAASGAKPASTPPFKDVSPGKAMPKPGDLLSPY